MYIGKTRSPVVVILLSIVTCGIYYIYWLYTIMDDLNKAAGREVMNPIMFTVLSIVCAPIVYYVFYTVDKSLEEISANEGTGYKANFILWLILSLVCGVGLWVGMAQLTDGFNAIWAARGGGASNQTPNAF